jgi:hypothetical protein
MAVYTASFDYTGRAPTSSFMESLINGAGYTNIEEISIVTWEITTQQKLAVVKNGLEIEIKNNGKYTAGKIVSVSVEDAAEKHGSASAGSA